MLAKTALVLTAFVGAMAFAAPRTADACGMRWEPEPANAMLLAEAAELEEAEQTFAALRTYERAMNDHRADSGIRAKAALSVARLRTQAGDVAESNQAYARAARFGAEAAIEAITGESAMTASMSGFEAAIHGASLELGVIEPQQAQAATNN